MPRSPYPARAIALAACVLLAACDRNLTAPDLRHAPSAPRGNVVGFVTPMVSAGVNNSCAVRSTGGLVCWGSDGNGVNTPLPVSAKSVGIGYNHACAITSSDNVVCWGANDHGQATPPSGLASVSALAVGAYHNCAVSDGAVTCWGSNEGGAASPPSSVASPSTFAERVRAVAAGFNASCAIRNDATLVCWGSDDFGALALPSGLTGVASVSMGDVHSCALSGDGSVVCWGDDSQGETDVPVGLTGVTEVSAGGQYTCALKSDHTVQCWGASWGTPPAGLTDVAMLSSGNAHSCVVKMDGSVVCWGYDGFGDSSPPAGLNLYLLAQPISFTSTPPSPAYFGTTYYVATTVGRTGNPVVLSSLTPAVCSVSASTVTLAALGSCTIAADEAGDGTTYEPTRITQAVTVQPGVQSISFTSAPLNPAYAGTSYAVGAVGGASGNPVMFSSQTPTVCTVTANSVSLLAVGTCTVAADQAGNGNYLAAATVTQSIPVSRAPQIILFGSAVPNPALLGGSYIVSASGGGSGNAVVFSSITPAACVLSGATVSFVGVGTCSIVANQAGNAAYLDAAQVTQSVAVVYPFTGYDAFANLPTLNAARAGSTVSLDFSLGGDRGSNVLGAGSPTTVSLPGCGTMPSGLEAPRTVSNRTLSYNKRSGTYTLSVGSDKEWLGTCRQLVMRLADGSEHRANFQFVK